MEIKIVFRGCVPIVQWMGNNVRYVLHVLITMHWTRVTQLLGTGLKINLWSQNIGFMAYNSMKRYQNLINWKMQQRLIQQFGLVQHVDCSCFYSLRREKVRKKEITEI